MNQGNLINYHLGRYFGGGTGDTEVDEDYDMGIDSGLMGSDDGTGKMALGMLGFGILLLMTYYVVTRGKK